MTEAKQAPAGKPRLDERKYALGQLLFNLGGVAFIAFAGAAIIFKIFGEGTGSCAEAVAFIFTTVFFFTPIQLWAAVTNTRRDFLRGKWFMAQAPDPVEADNYVANPWRLVLPLALPAGFIMASIAALAALRLGPYTITRVALLAGIPLLIATLALIAGILPRDQRAFAAALIRPRLAEIPPRRHLLVEHLLPWLPIQGAINFGVGLKQFYFMAEKNAGLVNVKDAALDAGFVFALIFFLCFMSSQVQVRPDVRLGRVAEDRRKALSVTSLILIFVLSATICLPVWAVLHRLYGPGVPPVASAIFKAVAVMAGVVPGCALGARWGARRETALIDGKSASTPPV
jgi:hypothetical protein